MAPDERAATRTAERCETHPGRPAVADCDRCGRALCLLCATPVRGEVLGPECLSEVLGGDVPPPVPESSPRSLSSALQIGGLAIAGVATLLPWTHFGTGDGFAGGWALDWRWSVLSCTAAIVGLIVWLVAGAERVDARSWTAIGCGGVAAAAGVLAFVNGPPLTRPWLGPVVAICGGGLAVAGGLWSRSGASAYARRRSGERPRKEST